MKSRSIPPTFACLVLLSAIAAVNAVICSCDDDAYTQACCTGGIYSESSNECNLGVGPITGGGGLAGLVGSATSLSPKDTFASCCATYYDDRSQDHFDCKDGDN